jgi:hypothetical protein
MNNWKQDEDFVAWLDDENLGTTDNPLDDETLVLMYRAWLTALDKCPRWWAQFL